MSNELYAEYNVAIGVLKAARKQYAEACLNLGVESWAAEQAQEYLTREVAHRERVRERYDAAARNRLPGQRDV